VNSGYPSDAWGWAADVGLKVNTPFISQGDWFQAQVALGGASAASTQIKDQSNWMVSVGAHRNFLP
jgi:hypothetical protein